MIIENGLGHYTSVLRQWLWLIILVTGFCTGFTYVINTLTPPVYEAVALIQIHDVSTANNNIFTDQALAQSYALLVNNPTVLTAVARRIPQLSVRELQTQVSDSPLDNTQIIQVRATAKIPTLASNIANTVVDAFIKIQVDNETIRLKGVVTKLYKDLTLAKQRVYSDQAQLDNLQDIHASQDRITHQNDILNSDQVSYNSLLTNYDQMQQQLFQVSNIITVAQSASIPNSPISPHTFLNTLVAAALSCVATLVFVLLLDWIDTSVKTADDIEQLAHLKSLGSVPFYKLPASNSSSVLSPLIKNSTIEQSFIGVSVNVIALTKGTRSILMTGIRHKSGVSTAAANLAITLARSGFRVLLVDANLHNPSLSRVFKSPNTSGLTTVLTETEMFQTGPTTQICSWLNQLSTHIPYLYFLSSGPTSTTSATLFLSPNIHRFLDCLLQGGQDSNHKYLPGLVDIIIFDSAPIEDVNTLPLASSIDASILVIDSGKEHVFTLHKACTTLDRFSCTLLGVILNRQKSKHKSYFYTNRSYQPLSTDHKQIAKDSTQLNLLRQENNTFRPPILPIASTNSAKKTNTSTRSMANQNFGPILSKAFIGYESQKGQE